MDRALRFWGVLHAPGSQGTPESSALQQREPTGLRQLWLSSIGPALAYKQGKCLLVPKLLRKPAAPSQRPKAQECVLIFLPSFISGSIHSVNQPCLWGPAPDTRLCAKCRGFSKVRVDAGGRRLPLGEGRA